MSQRIGYGTTDGSQRQQNDTAEPAHTPSEESALLPKSTPASSSRLHAYMTADVSTRWGDLVLLCCYLITGLLDSSSIFIWGSFVSMQTGNTVYLGLGLVEPAAGQRWIQSLISIGFFCLGSLCFSRFHRFFSPKRRWVLVVSFSVQLLLIIAAAVMVTVGTAKANGLNWRVIVPLALLAFQSSGQAVTSRALQYNSMTSVVLPSIYCDLFSDPKLFTGITTHAERNRRVAAPLLLLCGAMFGGLFAHSPFGLAGALWTAAVLKALVVLAWLTWAAEAETDRDPQD